LNEPFIKRVPELIDELSGALLPYLDRPVALLGHSLGARIAFEFARRIKARAEGRQIVHLFVSGCLAPHLPMSNDPIHALPDEQFLQKVREYEGTPEELLSDTEFMQLFLPRLRADFELHETYTFEPQEVLQCPITAWVGHADVRVPADSLEAWKQHTRGRFRSQMLQGGHFAFYERESEVLPQISGELAMFL
jgi:medium-chain acyl-[acyl-carrier-protein] hydrolase